MTPILQVKNLVVRFHTHDSTVYAINGASFDLMEGEVLAIVGESGCGKTVTVQSLLRLIPEPPGKIEGGEALFFQGSNGVDLLKLSTSEMRQIRGGQIGIIFQDPMTSLHPTLSIGMQIAETLIENLGMSKRQARERTIELLDRVGIPNAKERYKEFPHQFSGGMRQRVMIAAAVACKPKVLIADEPTTALDVTIQAQIIELINDLREEMDLSVIWITHDLGVVAGIADTVVVMYGGRVVENARVDDLYDSPQHPYTIGLLGALPRLDETGSKRLTNIEGNPPELLEAPTYCTFAPRCQFTHERCWQEIPPQFLVKDHHLTACFYQVKKGM